MKITIESTARIVMVENSIPPLKCRVWEGVTEKGVPIQVLVPRIAALIDYDQEQLENELTECRAPTEPQAFPMRLII